MWALDSTALTDRLAIGVIHKGGNAIKCLLGNLPLEEDGVSKQTRQDGFVKTYSLTAQEPWAGFEVGGGDLETPGEPHLQAWSLSSYSPGGSSISCV